MSNVLLTKLIEKVFNNVDVVVINNFTDSISVIEKHEKKILALSNLFINGRGIDFYFIQNFLNKKLSFKKFCVMARNSYKDTYLRFKRTPTIGMGGISELRHKFVNSVGQKQNTSFEIFNSFLNYIYGDINEAFTSDGFVRKYSTHYLINNFLNF